MHIYSSIARRAVYPLMTLLCLSMATGCSCGAQSHEEVDSGSQDASTASDSGNGDSGSAGDSGSTNDGGESDAGLCEGETWESVSATLLSISLLDPEQTVTTDRTVRFAITHELRECEEPGRVSIAPTLENEFLVVDAQVFRPVGVDCPAADPITRIVPYEFLYDSTWRVPAPSSGADWTPLVVGSPSRDECSSFVDSCQRDCDCGGLERCVGSHGFATPGTSCHRICETDRDCGDSMACISIGDGPSFVCVATSTPECAADRPCPADFECRDGACRLPPLTGENTPCRCDDDCGGPLHCIDLSSSTPPDQPSHRCQLPCRSIRTHGSHLTSAAGWCPAGYVCGGVGDASICTFIGE